jgi:ectoine hydroxylase-related dioxygenase (phytanoyl-CoA dioxygenase family)
MTAHENLYTDGVRLVRDSTPKSRIASLLRLADEIGPDHPDSVVTGRGYTNDLYGWRQSAAMRDFIADAAIGALVRPRCPILLGCRLLIRDAGPVRATPWHTDFEHWPVRCDFAWSVWLALDDEAVDSGALNYAKRSHTDPWTAGAPVDSYEMVLADLTPGDLLIFDPRVVHGRVTPGYAAHIRRFVITRWVSAEARYRSGSELMPLAPGHGLAPDEPLVKSPLFAQ